MVKVGFLFLLKLSHWSNAHELINQTWLATISLSVEITQSKVQTLMKSDLEIMIILWKVKSTPILWCKTIKPFAKQYKTRTHIQFPKERYQHLQAFVGLQNNQGALYRVFKLEDNQIRTRTNKSVCASECLRDEC